MASSSHLWRTTFLLILIFFASFDKALAKEKNTTFSREHISGQYKIDPSHAYVGFSVSHLGFSQQIGNFENVKGTITLNKNNPAKSKVNIKIKADSLYSSWKKRDKVLKGRDFFNVKKHPFITFDSTSVKLSGTESAKVTGNLKMLGVSKPVTLNMRLNKSGEHLFSPGNYVVGFSGTANLKRSHWGMKSYSWAIGDDVKITIEMEILRPFTNPDLVPD